MSGPEHAILLAGGRGLRLRPHTLTSPKPMVKLDRWAILEIILRQLRSCDVKRVTLCVSHLAEVIMDELGDGRDFGLAIDYCVDEVPRGTAGPLAAVPEWTGPALVMNADILTRLDFADLLDFHIGTEADLTVVSHTQRLDVDYGVLHVSDDEVITLIEKPVLEVDVSAGIYVASPAVRDHVPAQGVFGMNDLVQALLGCRRPVKAYRFDGEWHDIGTPERLEAARRSFVERPQAFLPDLVPGGPAGQGRAGRPHRPLERQRSEDTPA